MSELNEWDTFYVIVGGAAGALIGLQFVVLTLLAERPPRDASRAGAAFATPTIVHFSVVLLLSALLRAPWKTITPLAVLWGAVAVAGFLYSCLVIRRVRVQVSYKPAVEDWLFYVVLPIVAYAVLGTFACLATTKERVALFGVGAAALLLLFVGIHNAWDAVAYHVLSSKRDENGDG